MLTDEQIAELEREAKVLNFIALSEYQNAADSNGEIAANLSKPGITKRVVAGTLALLAERAELTQERDDARREVKRLRGIIITAENDLMNDHTEQAARVLAAEVERTPTHPPASEGK